MHLKAINTIIHNGQTHKPGTVFEVEGTDAEVLVAGGFAVQSDEAPAQPAPKQQTKAEKAAAAKAAAEQEAAEKAAAEDAAAKEAADKAAAGGEGNAD